MEEERNRDAGGLAYEQNIVMSDMEQETYENGNAFTAQDSPTFDPGFHPDDFPGFSSSKLGAFSESPFGASNFTQIKDFSASNLNLMDTQKKSGQISTTKKVVQNSSSKNSSENGSSKVLNSEIYKIDAKTTKYFERSNQEKKIHCEVELPYHSIEIVFN